MRKIQNAIRMMNGSRAVSSDHQGDDPVPSESKTTLCSVSSCSKASCRLVARIVDPDLALRPLSVV